jgi:PAP2 superfamily
MIQGKHCYVQSKKSLTKSFSVGAFRVGRIGIGVVTALFTLASARSAADVVTDWNVIANDIIVAANSNTLTGMRAAALVQTAVFYAANAISRRYDVSEFSVSERSDKASVDAAIAAANRRVLLCLFPQQSDQIESSYRKHIALQRDLVAVENGIAIGTAAADTALSSSAYHLPLANESFRVKASPGRWTPTSIPLGQKWGDRSPWFAKRSSDYSLPPPPKLSSKIWARDFVEVRALGGQNSLSRSPEQTEIARFWIDGLPNIYHGVLRSYVDANPTRDVVENARLFAAVAQAQDEAAIVTWEIKFRYNFWRPITAIRNADRDGNPATVENKSWVPFLTNTPMHPEYPSGHSALAKALATVLNAEKTASLTSLRTTSLSAKGVVRTWNSVDDLAAEVSNARVYAGVHYRFSVLAGERVGTLVGKKAIDKFYVNQ